MKEFITMDLKGKILIALVFMVFGFMLTVQYKATENQKTVRLERVEDLSERLRQTENENRSLRDELDKLRKVDSVNAATEAEMERLSLLAGATEVEGAGIEIVLDDSTLNKKSNENANLYIIHDEDLLRVLNELRSAGAEAISINDQRIVAMSEVRCAGPTVSVNNVRSAAPYVIRAIGNAKTMTSALRLRGGVVETFEFWGIYVKISNKEKMTLPALKSHNPFEYAKSVKKEEKK
ncbi:MAG: DUF881 domain-containing protein [Acidaminococcaceae bacterium]|nr:DUF881 domain-containing protein [Acidaminococcaceae bacterium]